MSTNKIYETLKWHVTFYRPFKSSSPPTNPIKDLIMAMKELLWWYMDSPDKDRVVHHFVGPKAAFQGFQIQRVSKT
jgi:hypothetical protein